MKITSIIHFLAKKQLITAVFITASIAAFATLGEKGKKGSKKTSQKSLLSTNIAPQDFKTFSLKSRYNYRGNTIISNPLQQKYVTLNTSVVTYEKGNTVYILPLKKRSLEIKVNPAR